MQTPPCRKTSRNILGYKFLIPYSFLNHLVKIQESNDGRSNFAAMRVNRYQIKSFIILAVSSEACYELAAPTSAS